MDLILGRFWGADGKALGAAELDLYEDLLCENDQDLYAWICGNATPPDRFVSLIARIRIQGARRAGGRHGLPADASSRHAAGRRAVPEAPAGESG